MHEGDRTESSCQAVVTRRDLPHGTVFAAPESHIKLFPISPAGKANASMSTPDIYVVQLRALSRLWFLLRKLHPEQHHDNAIERCEERRKTGTNGGGTLVENKRPTEGRINSALRLLQTPLKTLHMGPRLEPKTILKIFWKWSVL